MVWVKLCGVEAVAAGSMKQFYIKDSEVLLINKEGQFFCLDARCTHAGAPLEEGTLEGETLTCPWHGSQFRITDGSVQRGPAEKQLKKYEVTVKEGFIFIEA